MRRRRSTPPIGDRSGARTDRREDVDRRRRLRQLVVALGLVVLVVAGVATMGAFKRDPTDGASTTTVGGMRILGVDETASLLRGLPQQGTVLGESDAPVTILVVSDLKCPSCQAHALTTQRLIVERLVRTGRANLRLELVNLRDRARGTSDGARARRTAYALAPTDRFWSFVQTLFWNQGRTEDEWATTAVLGDIAAAAPGVPPVAITDRESPATRVAVAAADREARALRTDATPSIYVVPRGARTGPRVTAIDDLDAIERAVDRATMRR